ncbi:MAG TPA: hypothetical protein VGJ25_09155 [Gaiellaceae bacterium]|jgi:hypothetical protein
MPELDDSGHAAEDVGGVAEGEPRSESAEREAETEPEADTHHQPQSIRLGDRVVFLGDPGQGKSEGMLNLFAIYGGQRILIDVQDHYELGPAALAEQPPPLEVDDPREIDWQHRTIRYVPRRPGDRREMDALHHAIFQRGDMLVAADELEDIAPSQGGGPPPFVRKVLKQGRKIKVTFAGTSQRTAGIDLSARNAEHACVFRLSEPDDLRAIAGRLGLSVYELHQALNALGEHEYLRHDKGVLDERGRPLVIHMPALPAQAIEATRQHVINPYYSHRG